MQLTDGQHVNDINWQSIARYFQQYKAAQLRQAYIQQTQHFKRGAWTKEEDLKTLIGYRIFKNNWAKIRDITGINRKGVQIRERVEGKLSMKLKTGLWDAQTEDPQLLAAYNTVLQEKGNSQEGAFWSEVARRLQRTRKTVVRRWNTLEKIKEACAKITPKVIQKKPKKEYSQKIIDAASVSVSSYDNSVDTVFRIARVQRDKKIISKQRKIMKQKNPKPYESDLKLEGT